jgi:protein involved in ribonucleotide reduction
MDGEVVYFSSVSGNTARFIVSCEFTVPVERVPLKASEPQLVVTRPYVLITPTYGGGESGHAVPVQVKRFLQWHDNWRLMRGVIAAGNMNFGTAYGKAGDVLSSRFHVPMLYRFELTGTERDRQIVRDGVEEFLRSLPA